jgi:hypothetical protein
MVPRLRTTNKSRRSRFVHDVHFQFSNLSIFRRSLGHLNGETTIPSSCHLSFRKDDYLLKDLEPLGWIKTQALELPHLSPNDITSQAKIMADHPEWGSSSICITAAFTPGSVSLSAHSLTVPGFEWGRKNQDTSPNPQVRFHLPDPSIFD